MFQLHQPLNFIQCNQSNLMQSNNELKIYDVISLS